MVLHNEANIGAYLAELNIPGVVKYTSPVISIELIQDDKPVSVMGITMEYIQGISLVNYWL